MPSFSNQVRFMILSVMAMLLVAMPAMASTAALKNIEGDVFVARSATPDKWEKLSADATLESADIVKTEKGSCVIVYPNDQATFVVDPNTQVTVTSQSATEDLTLLKGFLRGKVNHAAAVKPFQVATPAAVAAVRGTEVDFGFDDDGQMTVDLHDGKIQVLNDEADLALDLGGKKKINIKYDKESGSLSIKNDCGSDGPVSFSVLGASYSANPCGEQKVDLTTAEGNQTNNNNTTNNPSPENPDEGRQPISPDQP